MTGNGKIARLPRAFRAVSHYLIHCLREVREGVDRNGELTEAGLKDLKFSLRDQPDDMVNYETNPNVNLDFTNKFGPIPCVWIPVGWKTNPSS